MKLIISFFVSFSTKFLEMESRSYHDVILMKEWWMKVLLSNIQILSFHASEQGGSELGTSCSKIFGHDFVCLLRHVSMSQSC